MESAMYLYPWEVDDFDTFAKEYAQTGCNSVAPALCYHHGNTLNARSGHFRYVPDAALSFAPDESLYGEMKPAVHRQAAQSGTAMKMRQWCQSTGRAFSGWVVLLHNSTLGEKHPQYTVENMMGDRYIHALCPAHGEVVEYTSAVLTDICTTLAPDSLILESATVEPAQHGLHHEIANIKMAPALRWLYSLCFCPACLEKAGAAGLDAEKARAQAKELALRLANSETSFAENGDAQILMLLLECPDLYAYQVFRQHIVTEHVRGISRLLREKGVQYRHIPSAVPFEVNNVFMEGMSFAQTKGLADMLVPLVYGAGETYPLVKNNIRLLDETTPLGMATSLLPARHPGKGSLVGAVAEAQQAGCECFYFYNFSLASRERLSWMPDVNRLLGTV